MLIATDIRKAFLGVQALRGVQLRIAPGTVHALLGENGAGKSTIIKILSGVLKPDNGVISYDGVEQHFSSSHDAHRLGIRVVYQELSLFENLTVAENLFANCEPSRLGFIKTRRMIDEAQRYLDEIGVSLDARALVQNLSLPHKQLLEIARAMHQNPRLLILDEPTSSLDEHEVEILFSLIKKLKAQNAAVLYVSHKMSEIFAICDEVTVFKDGAYVANAPIAQTSKEDLIQLMVGRKLDALFPPKPDADERTNRCANDAPLLCAEHITCEPYYRNVSLTARAGEIIGLYGLMGAGRTEIAHGIFGVHPPASGSLMLYGAQAGIKNVGDAIKRGIALVTEDRKQQGLVLTANVAENISMVRLAVSGSMLRFLSKKAEVKTASDYAKQLSIKTPGVYQRVNNLSGGNQQKVVLAKWLHMRPNIIIFDEPTRGIDVGTKYEIYGMLYELARAGNAVILISSELPEIMNLTDRIYLVKNNTIVSELATARATEDEIMSILTA